MLLYTITHEGRCSGEQERYSKLARLLKQRLEPAERGDLEAVRKAAEADAERMSQLPFGAPMLHLIGCALWQETMFMLLGNIAVLSSYVLFAMIVAGWQGALWQ